MPTALVIGASRGIGREFVRQLREQGWQVHAGVRSESDFDGLKAMGALPFKLDVTRADSLAAMAWTLDGVELDLALYVAGVYHPRDGADQAPTQADFDATMHVNLLGAMQAIPVLAPMVEASRGRFVFVTSGMGSIAEAQSSVGWLYRCSKAALNMAVRCAAFDYPKATLIALSPGWVQTDMGGVGAPLTVDESVGSMLRALSTLTVADSGGYFGHDGRRLPW